METSSLKKSFALSHRIKVPEETFGSYQEMVKELPQITSAAYELELADAGEGKKNLVLHFGSF